MRSVAGVQIGKAGASVTNISQAYSDRVEVRGRDLCGDLMGRLSFTEYFHLLLTGSEPTEDQRFFLDLLLVSIAEHGMMPTNVAARMTLAGRPRLAAGCPRGGNPRRRPGHPRHVRALRAPARGCAGLRSHAARDRRRDSRGRRESSGLWASGSQARRPARRADSRTGGRTRSRRPERRALARVPRSRSRGVGQAADDERRHADRGGDARPQLPGLVGEGCSAARAHGRPARASGRGATAPLGFLMAGKAEEAIDYERAPE